MPHYLVLLVISLISFIYNLNAQSLSGWNVNTIYSLVYDGMIEARTDGGGFYDTPGKADGIPHIGGSLFQIHTSNISGQDSWKLNIGEWYGGGPQNYGMTTGFLVFQMPDLGNISEPFLQAELGVRLNNVGDDTNFNADLWAVRNSISPNLQLSDWYVGPSGFAPSNAGSLIQKDFLITSMKDGNLGAGEPQIFTSIESNNFLVSYLNQAYDSGNGIGKYLFFRINPNHSDSFLNNWQAYELLSSQSASGDLHAPLINYTLNTHHDPDIPPEITPYETGSGGRGRPTIDASLGFRRILTDKGSLIRGLSLSFDGGDPYNSNKDPLPPLSSFYTLSNDYGINAVHVYLEGDSSGNPEPVGINLTIADKLVSYTRETGLYLVITIGCNGENGTIHSMDKTLDFWTLYADRYKDETHVIFEAHNEPVPYTLDNFTVDDWDKQLEMYQHIRSYAPNSLILLGSFMSFYEPGSGDTWGANYLKSNGVSWSNAAFAFHGYWDNNQIRETIEVFQSSANYPALICTEFWPGDTENGFNNLCESKNIGWLQFEWFSDSDSLLMFKGKIENAGTVWRPDNIQSKWPSLGEPNIPIAGEKFGLFCRSNQKFMQDFNGFLTANLSSYSENDSESFEVENLVNGHVAIKSNSGKYLTFSGTMNALSFNANSITDNEIWDWIELPNGDIVLKSVNAESYFIAVNGFGNFTASFNSIIVNNPSCLAVVKEPKTMPLGTRRSYFGNPFVIPSYDVLYAAEYDYGGQNISINDTDGDNIDDVFRKDYGVDIEVWNNIPIIGYFDVDEWLEYTISVEESGNYDFLFGVASDVYSGEFYLELNGERNGPIIQVPNTGGWYSFQMLKVPNIYLESGEQILRVTSLGNFNFLSIQAEIDGFKAPSLIMDLSNDTQTINLEWPVTAFDYHLYSKNNMHDSFDWYPSGNLSINNGLFKKTVSMPVDSISAFYKISTAD